MKKLLNNNKGFVLLPLLGAAVALTIIVDVVTWGVFATGTGIYSKIHELRTAHEAQQTNSVVTRDADGREIVFTVENGIVRAVRKQ